MISIRRMTPWLSIPLVLVGSCYDPAVDVGQVVRVRLELAPGVPITGSLHIFGPTETETATYSIEAVDETTAGRITATCGSPNPDWTTTTTLDLASADVSTEATIPLDLFSAFATCDVSASSDAGPADGIVTIDLVVRVASRFEQDYNGNTLISIGWRQ